MITLYGIEWSRANYVLFALEEIGIDYQHVKTHPFEEGKNSPEYLKLNPMAQVPTLMDGDFVLTESMAINFYLARKYGAKNLWVDQLEDEAQIYKWTFFAVAQMEAACVDIIFQRKLVDDENRNFKLIISAEKRLMKPLSVLDNYLANKHFLVANKFTIADINVAGVLSFARGGEYDFTSYKNVARYLDNILSRPGRKRAEAA